MAVDKQRKTEMEQAAEGMNGHLVGAFGNLGLMQPMVDMDTAEDLTVDGHEADPLNHAAEHQAALTEKAHNYAMKSGFDDGSAAGMRLHIVNEGGGGIGSKSGGKRAQERAYREAVLAALDNGNLPELIAEQVIGGLSDEAIADMVGQIEAETGQSFEDYAADILGEEAAQRLPGESLEEYRRRVLTALAEEMLDEHGNIKPEYADDPLAGMLRDNEDFQRIIAERDAIRAYVAENGVTAAAVERADEATRGDGGAADVIGHEDYTEIGHVSTNNQDEVRDEAATAPESAAENEDEFAIMSGHTPPVPVDGLVEPPTSLSDCRLTETFDACRGELHGQGDQAPIVTAEADPGPIPAA